MHADPNNVILQYPKLQTVRDYINQAQIKNIDNLVKFTSERIKDSTNNLIYEFLLNFESFLVLSILKSESNFPSVHDLYLIEKIMYIRQQELQILHEETLKEILEVYNNRKV